LARKAVGRRQTEFVPIVQPLLHLAEFRVERNADIRSRILLAALEQAEPAFCHERSAVA
jgi:hypothetical protein